jgi:hypothetical protein
MIMRHFEEIDVNNLENYYSKEISVGSTLIDVDLNFENKNLNVQQVLQLNTFLTNIKSIVDKSWQWILADYKNGSDVNEYISFHLDDFFEDDPESILKGTDPSLDNKDRFMQTLKVNRIGVYPSSIDSYLIIDWMTDPELSNYILVVLVNNNFELEYITIES